MTARTALQLQLAGVDMTAGATSDSSALPGGPHDYPLFTDRELEDQSGSVTCPRHTAGGGAREPSLVPHSSV